MKRYWGIAVIGIIGVLLSGCMRRGDFEPVGAVASAELTAYTLKTPVAYAGDSGYYHEVQAVEILEEPLYRYRLSGEVLTGAGERSAQDNRFVLDGWVDSEKWVMTFDSKKLNDSEFKTLILLKTPIEPGAKWTFETTDYAGETVEVEAEIATINKNAGTVTVHYLSETSDETRVFAKDKGTVQFSKTLRHRGTSAITGYARVSAPETVSAYDALESKTVDAGALEVVYAFNRELAKGREGDFSKLVVSGSPAEEKAAVVDDTVEVSFEGLKVYEVVDEKKRLVLKAFEKYKLSNAQWAYSRSSYELHYSDGAFKLYDFKPIWSEE